ncbi:hypothetical protein VNO77_06939 [Canavalia gladiata]|uniref:RING-type E3 ubiquitin transferase n=1 Tax=Canavalia gladiata TaxID=3824 RepID=A0AAN9M8P9_CANGL
MALVSSIASSDEYLTPLSQLSREAISEELDGHSSRSPSVFSTRSYDGSIEPLLTPNLITDGSGNVLDLNKCSVSQIKDYLQNPSPPSLLSLRFQIYDNVLHIAIEHWQDGGMDYILYDRLQQAMAEAEDASRDAYKETIRRQKAQKEALEAIHKAKATKILYKQELKLRKELEETVKKANEELDNMKSQSDKVNEELKLVLDQKLSLENQIASIKLRIKELEQQIIFAEDLLQKNMDELDKLQMQRDNALKEAEKLRRKQGEASSTRVSMLPRALFSRDQRSNKLITGRPALGIAKEVQYLLDGGKLQSLLDPLAGDWPLMLVQQLACLALRCCEMNRKSRPDMYPDVWSILGPTRASSEGTSMFQLGSQHLCQPPSYFLSILPDNTFLLPSFLEVMRDPHIAADGFTYEAEAKRGWLESGHDTSPTTNSKLSHRNLVPYQALRHSIQDWLQTH